MADFSPPMLAPLTGLVSTLPAEDLPWIARSHVQYLDDRIHKIDRLTDYLANCSAVDQERREFIEFVETWTRRENIDVDAYLLEYSSRFGMVRGEVDSLCDRASNDASLWASRGDLLSFYRRFTYINEVDSLHGMFLTSGRWYVNVMLPIVKELVFCTLPDSLTGASRHSTAYLVARRVITPRFAETAPEYDFGPERRFAKLFIPVLQYFDRKLLFLFEIMADIPVADGMSLEDFVADVTATPRRYESLLDMGVYPPFAWHELHASRRRRRPALDFEPAIAPLMAEVPSDLRSRAIRGLDALSVFKDYELNYNNYNYKGRFGLISKAQYRRTAGMLSPNARERFLEAILLDRFYDALAVIEAEFDVPGGGSP